MLKRHEVLPSGLQIDRDWWHATKLVCIVVVALAAAYVVNATLL